MCVDRVGRRDESECEEQLQRLGRELWGEEPRIRHSTELRRKPSPALRHSDIKGLHAHWISSKDQFTVADIGDREREYSVQSAEELYPPFLPPMNDRLRVTVRVIAVAHEL